MDDITRMFGNLSIKEDPLKHYLTHGVHTCGHYKHWPNFGFGKEFSFYKNAVPLLKKPCQNLTCKVCPIIYGATSAINPWSTADETTDYPQTILTAEDLSLTGIEPRYDEHRDTVYDFSFREKRYIAKESIDNNLVAACNRFLQTALDSRQETFTVALTLVVPWTQQLLQKTGCLSYDVRMDWNVSDEEYELATDINMQTGFDVTPEIVLHICDRIDIYLDSFARFREVVKPYLDKLWLKCVQVVHFEAPADCKGQAIALKLIASPNMKHVNDTLASVLAQPQYLTDKIENYQKYHELAFSKKDEYFATVAYVPKNDPFNRESVKSFFNSLVGQYFECGNWHISMDKPKLPRPHRLDEHESLCG